MYRRRRLLSAPRAPALAPAVEMTSGAPLDKRWVPWRAKELPSVAMDWWASDAAYRASQA
jgi:hypothetical protein